MCVIVCVVSAQHPFITACGLYMYVPSIIFSFFNFKEFGKFRSYLIGAHFVTSSGDFQLLHCQLVVTLSVNLELRYRLMLHYRPLLQYRAYVYTGPTIRTASGIVFPARNTGRSLCIIGLSTKV